MLEIGDCVGIRLLLSSLEGFLRTFEGDVCLLRQMIETAGLMQRVVRKDEWHQEVYLYLTSIAKGCATAAHCFV